jgi:hypothetical protein
MANGTLTIEMEHWGRILMIYILLSIISGLAIIIAPYIFLYLLVEKANIHPGISFPALYYIIAPPLLALGGYFPGIILGKYKRKTSKIAIVFSTPGLYLAIFGFLVNFVIEDRIPLDGLISIIFVGLFLFLITTTFTFLAYKKYSKKELPGRSSHLIPEK